MLKMHFRRLFNHKFPMFGEKENLEKKKKKLFFCVGRLKCKQFNTQHKLKSMNALSDYIMIIPLMNHWLLIVHNESINDEDDQLP